MIDHEKIWPSNKVITTHNVTKDFEFYFKHYTTGFNCDCEASVSPSALIEYELKTLENKRDNISGSHYYDSDIELYPFFKLGWDMAIKGNFEVYEPSYFHFDRNNTNIIIDAIKTKYDKKDLPKEYFEQLSSAGEMQIIQGMASAKYYDWLKKQQGIINEKNKTLCETNSKHNRANIITLLCNTEYNEGKAILNNALSEDFTKLLNGNYVGKGIEWKDSIWMLYVIIESFIKNKIIEIDSKKIPEYMLNNFIFDIKKTRKKILDNLRIAKIQSKKGLIYELFTSKLNSIYE